MYTIIWQNYLGNKQVEPSHENKHIPSIGWGKAGHRKYKRLKLGCGEAYDHSND
jgi:hypothetical protein